MSRPTLHVLGLPHTQTTREFDHCAFTAKVRKFGGMMRAQGYRVVLYAGDENESDVDELVTLLPREEQAILFAGTGWWERGEVQNMSWDEREPYWQTFIERAERELADRLKPHDIVCLMTGRPFQRLIDRFSTHLVCEFGAGYEGVAAPFRVFESYAWMHAVYAARAGSATACDGAFYDAVIPNYYDLEEFPFRWRRTSEPYFAFLSRMTGRKGYEIAIETTRRLGVKLKIAGVGGDRPQADHVEYVGLVRPQERGGLLANALGTFMPTLYVEPFGGVVVESLLSGTPVISTDWGAFPELVEQGVDGFRCRTMAEFEQGAAEAMNMSVRQRRAIRRRARRRYGVGPVGEMYDIYFRRLGGLWGEGFYQ